MTRTIIRWSLYLAAALVLGPLAGQLVAQVEAADGGRHATALVGGSIGRGWVMTLGGWGLAAVTGLAAARLLGLRVGLTVGGLVMVWAAARSGSVEEILRITGSRGALVSMAIEGAVIGLLTAGLLAAMVLAARPNSGHDTLDGDDDIEGARSLAAKMRTPGFALSTAVAVAVGAAMVWLLAREGLKLQTIGAVTLGAIMMGAAGRLADHRSPSVFIGLAITILAVAGPLIAMTMQGAGVVDAAYAGMLHPLARPAPLDWAAGALLGSRWGLDWASSLMEKRVAAPVAK
jgi:hypothetical protein